ncbi:MAG: DUF3592 domain-containing protein [Marinifilaceae bacterium]
MQDIIDFIIDNIEIIIIGSLCVLFFCVFIDQICVYIKANKSLNWQTTDGEIIFSTLQTQLSDSNQNSSKTFKAVVSYKYIIERKEYVGDKIFFGDNIYVCSIKRPSQTVIKYPPEKKVIVYYNPLNIEETVLEPGVNSILKLIIAVMGLVIIFGLFLINSPILKLSL